MNEFRVNSWNELQDKLFENAWQPDIQRFRSPYAFRGVSEIQNELETSLMRLGGEYAEMEQHLLRNFRKYALRQAVERDSIWNWLSLAKHHGLPTRLLDWSYSPFVALHYSTDNIYKFDRDSVVWAVDFSGVHRYLPEAFKDELLQEGSDVLTIEMLSKVASTLAEFDSLSDSIFCVFFEPPSLDDRIVNQFALFSLMSDPRVKFRDWLTNYPDLFYKIIIPASLNWEIRDKLDQVNITERVLFPGLDGLSSWLKRQYSPRN